MKRYLILAILLLLAFAAADATSTPRERVQVVYQGAPGNYLLYVFGGQALRCRAEDLHISRDERGDGDGPIVIACR
ncbi:MAG TPA: hypothetical protein VFW94_23545 [Candidatus Acidoferrales bacterium]|nr:hypothetical protein [Candidatus Acidoferrales bacterium]